MLSVVWHSDEHVDLFGNAEFEWKWSLRLWEVIDCRDKKTVNHTKNLHPCPQTVLTGDFWDIFKNYFTVFTALSHFGSNELTSININKRAVPGTWSHHKHFTWLSPSLIIAKNTYLVTVTLIFDLYLPVFNKIYFGPPHTFSENYSSVCVKLLTKCICGLSPR